MFLVGLAVAELVSAYPLSGGVYQIVNRLTGKTWLAWQGGWWLVIAHTVAVTAVAVAIVPFVSGWFRFHDLTGFETTLWTLGILLVVTLVNVAGVKIAAFFNNLGVFAEIIGLVLVVGALLFSHYQRQPADIVFETAGTTDNQWWVIAFLFAMLLSAFTISSFDSTGNAAEETIKASWTAPMGTFLASIAAYVTGIIFIFLLNLAIPDVDETMASATPVELILRSSIGDFITDVFIAVAILALFANMCHGAADRRPRDVGEGA